MGSLSSVVSAGCIPGGGVRFVLGILFLECCPNGSCLEKGVGQPSSSLHELAASCLGGGLLTTVFLRGRCTFFTGLFKQLTASCLGDGLLTTVFLRGWCTIFAALFMQVLCMSAARSGCTGVAAPTTSRV